MIQMTFGVTFLTSQIRKLHYGLPPSVVSWQSRCFCRAGCDCWRDKRQNFLIFFESLTAFPKMSNWTSCMEFYGEFQIWLSVGWTSAVYRIRSISIRSRCEPFICCCERCDCSSDSVRSIWSRASLFPKFWDFLPMSENKNWSVWATWRHFSRGGRN